MPYDECVSVGSGSVYEEMGSGICPTVQGQQNPSYAMVDTIPHCYQEPLGDPSVSKSVVGVTLPRISFQFGPWSWWTVRSEPIYPPESEVPISSLK